MVVKKRERRPNGKACKVCGKELAGKETVACSDQCRRELSRRTIRDYCKGVHIEKKAKPKQKPKPIMTDAEQREINRRIDTKFNMTMEVRTIRPGDPEFDTIAATITPIKDVKFKREVGLYASKQEWKEEMFGV